MSAMHATSIIGDMNHHVQTELPPPFLRLPRELRDLVYEHYFRADGGFTYDFAANQLKQASDLPIPLSLTLVCRQIHNEVQGLALGLNTIAFTTSFTETTREIAGSYNEYLRALSRRKLALVNNLAPQLLSIEMANIAAGQYPQFKWIVDIWLSGSLISFFEWLEQSWGETPSVWRDFIDLVINLISKNPRFVDHRNPRLRFWAGYSGDKALELVNACTRPWIIPDVEELAVMKRLANAFAHHHMYPFYSPTTKYAYSAASSAIRFLHSITPIVRLAVRNIHLSEDRESVAFPSCHGRGFIPICQENPKLRVTHTVSLWSNAFPVSDWGSHHYITGDSYSFDAVHDDCLLARKITKSVGKWLIEASILLSLGIPENSYTLILDGGPDIKYTSEVFHVVQRDIAWQSAYDMCQARGLLPQESVQVRRRHHVFTYENLPEIVRNLSRNGALIRTNFDPGTPCNPEDLIEEHQGWSAEDWLESQELYEPEWYQTQAPLPPWHILRWQHVLYDA